MPGCSEFSDPLPPGLKQIGAGLVTATDSKKKFIGTGGQACYVELTNGTIHLTPVTVRYYEEGPAGETDICTSSFTMKPTPGESILKQTVFGDVITWRVEVSLALEVDVAQIACRVLTTNA